MQIHVLNQHNMQQSTNLKVYKTVVLTSLLYGCENWALEHLHMQSLCSIQGIKWQDRYTNLEAMDCTETTNTEAIILKAQIR